MQSPYIIDVHNNVDVVFLFCFVLFCFFFFKFYLFEIITVISTTDQFFNMLGIN